MEEIINKSRRLRSQLQIQYSIPTLPFSQQTNPVAVIRSLNQSIQNKLDQLKRNLIVYSSTNMHFSLFNIFLHKHISNLFDWIRRLPFALFSPCHDQGISRKSSDQTNKHSSGQMNAFFSDSHFDKSLHNTVHRVVQFAEQFCMPNAKEPIVLE